MFVWSKLSSHQWRDAWEERFHGDGQTNAVITDIKGNKSIRVEVYTETKEQAEAIQEQFGGSVRELKMENWAAMTPPPGKPLFIRDQFIISNASDEAKVAELKAANPKKHFIHIPPELAFGTGDHPTTATCMRLLCDISKEFKRSENPEWSMLDLGTGTGLLAIAATKLGAQPDQVLATDFDPLALKVAKSNAERNETPTITFEESDVTQWEPPRQFRVVAANLFANVLIAGMPAIHKAIEPDGHLIVSGILHSSWPDVEEALLKEGLLINEPIRRGKWVTAHCRKASA
ncbi:50S ribosomal protein L11 methyltransferase [Sulfuriroseicoccus oceanibius]|uniref:50S ribosomal protein L11 methyltransferase n=1 Tax=Sulfuriroseicoccus oceanibius TaxID=2707525 RepID=A0A6B3LEH1_9BACT|nr:50S ribosomal protein L11 methyltransferase [Sulfuriroseicoccus oceanibius]QQL44969.1 50S ribosomal protein L11 methyltransferase [Sulfuriroseicoccus oceanibius]